jgi:hypothetical protein
MPLCGCQRQVDTGQERNPEDVEAVGPVVVARDGDPGPGGREPPGDVELAALAGG